MSIKLLTNRADIPEPVAVAEAKTHCHITHSKEDAAVGRWIQAAREHVENITRRQLVTAQYRLTLDDFPQTTRQNPYREIILPLGCLQSIGSVQYLDTDRAWQTLTVDDDYISDEDGDYARVVPAGSTVWPTTDVQPIGKVRVTFTCGYGDAAADVPEVIRGAVLKIVEYSNASRGAGSAEGVGAIGLSRAMEATLQSQLSIYTLPEIG